MEPCTTTRFHLQKIDVFGRVHEIVIDLDMSMRNMLASGCIGDPEINIHKHFKAQLDSNLPQTIADSLCLNDLCVARFKLQNAPGHGAPGEDGETRIPPEVVILSTDDLMGLYHDEDNNPQAEMKYLALVSRPQQQYTEKTVTLRRIRAPDNMPYQGMQYFGVQGEDTYVKSGMLHQAKPGHALTTLVRALMHSLGEYVRGKIEDGSLVIAYDAGWQAGEQHFLNDWNRTLATARLMSQQSGLTHINDEESASLFLSIDPLPGLFIVGNRKVLATDHQDRLRPKPGKFMAQTRGSRKPDPCRDHFSYPLYQRFTPTNNPLVEGSSVDFGGEQEDTGCVFTTFLIILQREFPFCRICKQGPDEEEQMRLWIQKCGRFAVLELLVLMNPPIYPDKTR
jgi:hypothetical protein